MRGKMTSGAPKRAGSRHRGKLTLGKIGVCFGFSRQFLGTMEVELVIRHRKLWT